MKDKGPLKRYETSSHNQCNLLKSRHPGIKNHPFLLSTRTTHGHAPPTANAPGPPMFLSMLVHNHSPGVVPCSKQNPTMPTLVLDILERADDIRHAAETAADTGNGSPSTIRHLFSQVYQKKSKAKDGYDTLVGEQ